MAAPQAVQSNTTNEQPRRSCIICCEPEGEGHFELIKPCRSCKSDYCIDCLLEMFISATNDPSRMPPRCCTLIQIHAVVEHLTEDQAKQYRTKFEEWISPTKTYCPVPTCSAFISEKYLPSIPPSTPPTLKSVLKEVLIKTSSSGSARFFRGEMDITELAGFTSVVKQHIDLTIMQDKIESYRSTNDLTVDMRLLVSNAKEYNGDKHPVSLAANELFNQYLLEVSKATDLLITATRTPAGPQILGCPKCHVAICGECKQVDHAGKACDKTLHDHEIAVLAAFGYKKCPRCGTGVKRMFGCSHMQCICGAHWCYWCQRSTEQCHGDCHPPDSEEDEGDYDSDEDESDEYDAEDANGTVVIARRVSPEPTGVLFGDVASTQVAADYRIENLDAGGARRWAETDYDFGSEPEEEPFAQVWSCNHSFKVYETPPKDGLNRGNLGRMECNRCSGKIEPREATMEFKASEKASDRKRARAGLRAKRSSVKTQQSTANETINDRTALECCQCRLLVCLKCGDKYQGENATEGTI